MNVRSVLEYVPYFRGRIFLVHIDASLLGADELVDALLDADALHEIGVRLVLVAEGSDTALLAHMAGACEMHAATVEMPLTDGEPAIARVREILERRQVAIAASGTAGRFAEPVVELALALEAAKYITLQEGQVPHREGQPIFAIPEHEVASCSDCTNLPELLQAAALCRRGIPRVHLLDGLNRGVMLDEIFSEEGVGTMVHNDSYKEIRQLQEDDIPELLSMIARSMADSKLLHRTYEDVRRNLHSYYVYTLDDTIVGCVAIYPYPQDACAELGCLFIKKHYEGHGYGRALCRFVENKARDLGFTRIFAVSQSAVDYFRDRLHYSSLPREILPAERLRALQESGRSSLVFGRDLNA
ncbi:MAG: GNAT family N-acetyltransferase [Akkermansia sp.]|nr:GNAT family N-acetyltransferase [Akkermansia sp.]